MGTILVNSNTLDFDTIFSGIQKVCESIYDIGLKEDTEIDETPRAIIERSHVEPLAYKEIVNYLKSQLGCQVYIFGYDWRKSCIYNGDKLKEYVEYLKSKLRIEKFNFITHSMGGLIFSSYLKKLNSNFDGIEHAILTVPPFKGSIEALKSLVEGESWLFNARENVRKIARTFPSIYELLPVYDNAVVFSNGSLFDITNLNHWQSNLLNDVIFRSRLTNYLNSQDYYDFSNIPLESKDKFLIIAGTNEETKTKVIIKPTDPDRKIQNFFDFDQPIGDGDGTVPIESATYYKNSVLTIAVESKWYDNTTHPFFLKDGRVQTIIYRFLNNNTSKSDWFEIIGGSVKRVV